MLDLIFLTQLNQMIDSALPTTRAFWRTKFFDATPEQAADPRPFEQVRPDLEPALWAIRAFLKKQGLEINSGWGKKNATPETQKRPAGARPTGRGKFSETPGLGHSDKTNGAS